LTDYLSTGWAENLGVEVVWDKSTSYDSLQERLRNSPPHIYLALWRADYPDPDNFLRICVRYVSRWQNDRFESLVERARWIPDQARRMNLYREADQILTAEAAILPLHYPRHWHFVKPWLKNAFLRGSGRLYFADLIIEPH
jgi:oligopeptide transport system substrate-binding protein